jgi:hypothetical protein
LTTYKESLSSNKGIQEYKGTWGQKQLVHLLKRTTFGVNTQNLNAFEKMTMSQVVDALFVPDATPTSLPVNHYQSLYADTTGVALGETWVNAKYGDGTISGYRRSSLKTWWIARLFNQTTTVNEKLQLFWHNHFAIEFADIDDARYLYRYFETLRKNALGPLKPFVKQITLDSSMLAYLNGNVNTKTAPDENYAREIQELFVIGKGPNSGYTESDVKEAAKTLTGWRNSRDNNNSYFTASLHDTTEKKFSAFYGNKTIKPRTGADGAKEVDDLLDILFSVDEVGYFIVRKFYTYFVNSTIDSTIEENVIKPLAKIYKESDYNASVVLKVLFKSEHFHDSVFYGCMVKSPLDLVVGHAREFAYTVNKSFPVLEYFQLKQFFSGQLSGMQQNLGDPPNVAGWGAYYQAPGFYDLWVNSDTFPKRNAYVKLMNQTGRSQGSYKVGPIDPLVFAQGLKNPADPNKLLNEIIEILYSMDLGADLKAKLKKDILLAGATTDSTWTNLWNKLVATPSDAATKKTLTDRLRALVVQLCEYPEYQLH